MKGICFKEHLFNATVKKTKTQTRRIIKIEDCSERHKSLKGKADWWNKPMTLEKSNLLDKEIDFYCCKYCGHPMSLSNLDGIKPRYNVGEVIFLKEPYYTIDSGQVQYKYEPSFFLDGCVEAKWTWKNKLFMPASKARFFIKITGVRAERLQDISDEDCMKEGIVSTDSIAEDVYEPVFENGVNATNKVNAVLNIQYETPREAYKALINKINGKETWDSNPYVWVYDYELIEK